MRGSFAQHLRVCGLVLAQRVAHSWHSVTYLIMGTMFLNAVFAASNIAEMDYKICRMCVFFDVLVFKPLLGVSLNFPITLNCVQIAITPLALSLRSTRLGPLMRCVIRTFRGRASVQCEGHPEYALLFRRVPVNTRRRCWRATGPAGALQAQRRSL